MPLSRSQPGADRCVLYVSCFARLPPQRRLSALPPCVAQLDGLALLDVGLNRLATLPPGPYLRSLRCLVARGNALRTLPPALVEAQQLEALDLGENEE